MHLVPGLWELSFGVMDAMKIPPGLLSAYPHVYTHVVRVLRHFHLESEDIIGTACQIKQRQPITLNDRVQHNQGLCSKKFPKEGHIRSDTYPRAFLTDSLGPNFQ
jgi:hypothetical protein